jgi:cytochrome c peroxidase
VVAAVGSFAICSSVALAVVVPPPPPEPVPPPPSSLKQVVVPVPRVLGRYVTDRDAAVRLGKALFWDMQVGSDGMTACASCHFHAGADNRTTSQFNPGSNAGSTTFDVRGPNGSVTASDFPFHRLSNPADASSTVLFDTDDVLSSQGVFRGSFGAIRPGLGIERVLGVTDPVFNVGGTAVRQVPGRNSPSAINAVFNVSNFWDGRAAAVFNGSSPWGPADPEAGAWVVAAGSLEHTRVAIDNGSLASQAVGPIGSSVEMAADGRSRAQLAKKLYRLRPLARQMVHPQDSSLGPLARTRSLSGATFAGRPGLRTWYPDMIRAAFARDLWESTGTVVTFDASGTPHAVPAPSGRPLADDEFTQMEANFPLFFGLAVQMYETTLVSDDAPFDRWREGDQTALTAQQKAGFNTFSDVTPTGGKCVLCHATGTFTNASVAGAAIDGLVELMFMKQGQAFYDVGFYNVGVRPTGEDIARGARMPFTNPSTGAAMPLSNTERGFLKRDGLLVPEMSAVTSDIPAGQSTPTFDRAAVFGAFKTPSLRNVELTGPYFHNGGQATLRQVVEFYERGGDFGAANIDQLPPIIGPFTITDAQADDLVAFLQSLTDERVRWERAPFDHPQLMLPQGRAGDASVIDTHARNRVRGATGFGRAERVDVLPAIGSGGRGVQGVPPLGPFLGLDPHQP